MGVLISCPMIAEKAQHYAFKNILRFFILCIKYKHILRKGKPLPISLYTQELDIPKVQK